MASGDEQKEYDEQTAQVSYQASDGSMKQANAEPTFFNHVMEGFKNNQDRASIERARKVSGYARKAGL